LFVTAEKVCGKMFRAIVLAHTKRVYELNYIVKMSIKVSTFGSLVRAMTLVCAVASTAASAETPDPVARVEVENTTVRRGSDTSVRVVTDWVGEPGAMVVLPVEYPEIEGAEWHGQQLVSERDGDTNRVVQTALLTVTSDEETLSIPEMAVVYRIPGEEEERELRTDALALTVRSAPFGTPVLGGILAAAGACFGVWLALRFRRRQRAADTGQPATGRSDILGRDLNSLRRLRLTGDYGAYFMGLVRIAREIEPAALDRAPLNDVAAMVESARYGGYQPDKELAERAYRAVERLLKRVQSVQAAEEE